MKKFSIIILQVMVHPYGILKTTNLFKPNMIIYGNLNNPKGLSFDKTTINLLHLIRMCET